MDRLAQLYGPTSNVTDDENDDDCVNWTVPKLQSYLVRVLNEEITSPSCGFPQWLDNHYSWDCSDDDCKLDDFVRRLEANKWKYHWGVANDYDQQGHNWWQVYTFDPSGYGVQLHFPFQTPLLAPPVDDIPPACFHTFENGTCPNGLDGQCT